VQATALKNTNKFLEDSKQYLNGNRKGQMVVRLAQSQYEIIEAQKLRYRVFSEEFGANFYSEEQRHLDEFDPFCKHLIALVDDRVVGTYRILFPEGAMQAGRMYSETEFDLATFSSLRQSTIEIGRSCVDPEFRNGQVLRRLWSALADILTFRPETHVIGCVSVPMHDGGYFAAGLYKQLQKEHHTSAEGRVFPFDPLPTLSTLSTLSPPTDAMVCDVEVPPLMRSYIKLGAKLLGEPHWDFTFNVADFPMVVTTAQIEKHFNASLQPEQESPEFHPSLQLPTPRRKGFSTGLFRAQARLGA
jgi:putative hemolysin